MENVDIKDFYLKHKAEILHIQSQEGRTTHKDLKYEVTLEGLKYYSVPETMQMPFMRMAKGMENMDWLKNGLHPEEFDLIRNEMYMANAQILANCKNPEQVKKYAADNGLYLAELERRRLKALPYYVMINLCANYLIREDEDPQVISSPILHEKCDAIQRAIESGQNAFFLTIPQLKPLSEVIGKSLEELNSYMTELKQEADQNHNQLKLYSSWIEQRHNKPTPSKV